MPISTMKKMWLSYKTACYPEGCNPTQEKECRQAFYSGALSFFSIMSKEIGALPDGPAEKALNDLYLEVEGVCKEYSISNFSGQN